MADNTIASVAELAAHIDDVAWCIIDCRHDLADADAGERAWRQAHIPGAQFLHLDRDLSGARTGSNGRHPLPDPATLARSLGRRGISNSTQVIAYDGGGMFAARLWWLLRWLGHQRVAVLDGGWPAWARAGYPVTDTSASRTAATFEWRLNAPTVDTAYVNTHLRRSDTLVVDARAPDRFRGENETLDPVGGHIPGAVNRWYQDNLAADGCFKPAAQLRGAFEQLLRGRPAQTIVSQCGSGVSACHNLLALEIAGLHGARLYPGSWSEWCSDPARPVARGAD